MNAITAVAPSSRDTRPGAGRVLLAVTRAEWAKLRSLRSTVWTVLAAIVLAIGFGALVAVSQVDEWDRLDPAAQARFDPTWLSLSGLFLAQLAIGVLGVLTITSEYATGQIRSTLAATPQRVTVVGAKVIAFVAVAITAGLITTVASFATGQSIFAGKGLGASLGDPGVARAVVGGALYLTLVGVFAIGIGIIVRRTAGAIATLVAVLLVVPIVSGLVPASWNEHLGKYLPARAGMAVVNVVPEAGSLAPWTGLAVLAAYAGIALGIGAILLRWRDA